MKSEGLNDEGDEVTLSLDTLHHRVIVLTLLHFYFHQ